MNLIINGESKSFSINEEFIILSSLIKLLGHHPLLIVIEYNGTIIPKDLWNKQKVKDGDTLEIVTIVGGGSYNKGINKC
tara:strand:- start:277 stop:513 length:237 start_codon:yes stop_codon:yes gene_type:complete